MHNNLMINFSAGPNVYLRYFNQLKFILSQMVEFHQHDEAKDSFQKRKELPLSEAIV